MYQVKNNPMILQENCQELIITLVVHLFHNLTYLCAE